MDFDNALQMVAVLLKHSSYVFSQIAQDRYEPKPKNRKEKFLESLPYNFNRQTFVPIALQLSIPDKTAQKYIKDLADAGIILYNGQDNYTNPSASNPQ